MKDVPKEYRNINAHSKTREEKLKAIDHAIHAVMLKDEFIETFLRRIAFKNNTFDIGFHHSLRNRKDLHFWCPCSLSQKKWWKTNSMDEFMKSSCEINVIKSPQKLLEHMLEVNDIYHKMIYEYLIVLYEIDVLHESPTKRKKNEV